MVGSAASAHPARRPRPRIAASAGRRRTCDQADLAERRAAVGVGRGVDFRVDVGGCVDFRVGVGSGVDFGVGVGGGVDFRVDVGSGVDFRVGVGRSLTALFGTRFGEVGMGGVFRTSALEVVREGSNMVVDRADVVVAARSTGNSLDRATCFRPGRCRNVSHSLRSRSGTVSAPAEPGTSCRSA